MIFAYQRFINWRLAVVDGKETKQPFDPRTGKPVDPNDPNNWHSHAAAVATGHPVGFAIAATDPFFFLDIDKALVGDVWIPEAVAIYQRFAGAGVEISQSGKGIHIIGRCDKLRTVDRRNKWGKESRPAIGNWLEFYTWGRFVAFGPYGWQGNFDQDCTDAIMSIVPKRETEAALLNVGASPDYTGPTDDDELIQKMLNSRGSINATFGAKASFTHLWQASKYADVLVQHFPSPSGDVYDRSSADAALMSHLAFWTGRDAARMDRLFRRSDLMRAKYSTRADYRNSTIGGAIANCKRIYDLVKTAPDQPDDPVPSLGEFLTIPDQLEYFKGCVYVRDIHRIMIPGGEMLTPPQFNAFFGGKQFSMSADNTGPTKKAFEAFTENRAHSFPKVHSTCFAPKATPGAIIDGRVNVYFPYHPVMKHGDPSRFLDHVAKLLPDPNDRAILLAYAAAVVQYLGTKLQWAPVIQGTPGNGKTIITECLEYCVGAKYAHRPSAEDLKNPFNSYLENKLLIAVEEIYTDGRRELLDMLKPLITNARIETQPKGVDKRMVDNVSNWIFLTNHRDAVPKDVNDRRYAIFFTAQQDAHGIQRDGMGGEYFPSLYRWLRQEDGFAIVANFLKTYQIPDALNPATTLHRAPTTSTTPEAILATRGKAEQELNEAIESGERGFRQGWISTYAVTILFKEKGIRISPIRLGEILRALGYREVCRAERPIMDEALKRPVLYVRADLYDARLTGADYERSQGYASTRPTVIDWPGHKMAGQ